jgi:hypothetical protein
MSAQEPSKNLPATVKREEVVLAARPVPTVADMLAAVIEKGVTQENVAAVGEIVKLYERVQARDAEKEFARAFVSLQAGMPAVKAVRAVPNNDGSVRYKFAPYEEIMEQVAPMLKLHGFTVTFSTDYVEGRIVKICTLQHVSGHSRSNQFAVRIGQGPPKATETQADGAASTYAKRGALCDALNIVIDHDDDARAEGGKVTADQAVELRLRVRQTNSNEPAFLKYAGAQNYEDIAATKYSILDGFLRGKENKMGRRA